MPKSHYIFQGGVGKGKINAFSVLMESLRCSKKNKYNIWIVFEKNDYHHFCKRVRSSSKQHLYQIKVIFREVDCFLRISLAHAFTISYVFFMFF